ncbi:MAG: PA14 domain-containing protein [Verrucomicrobiae bacterium]|nr:PA14 domain-containing protein [Verrucomicrobiae bacterium]
MKRYIVAILILMGLSALVFSFSRSKPASNSAPPDATTVNNVASPSTPTGLDSPATAATPTATTPNTAGAANITNHPAASTSLGGTVSPRQRPWDYTFLDQFHDTPQRHPVRFELVAGEFAAGTITHTEFQDGHVIVLAGELTSPETGRFSFRKQTLPGKAGDYSGEVTFPASQRAYRLEPLGAAGKTVLVERRLDEVLCLTLPPPDPGLTAADVEEMPPLRPDDVPNFVPPHNDGIISLQSLPGVVPVVYIDYRGGYTPTWGGITYEKPNVNNTVIKDVWKRVAEDFMPFNINVTTDIRVYEAAPENSRQRCVVTPTTTAAPGAGGVAYLQDWNNTGDRPCWSFYSSGKSAAEVISHEVGHTLALSHDGRTSPAEEYYGGQGSGAVGWAPIMGVGYSMPVVQWSKGEYANANQTQDDLYVITNNNNNVAYRADDTGATLATARYLEIYSNYTASAEGVIERTGDTDAFQFTTSGGAISLSANPVGDWANLAISATLADAAGTIMASNNPQTQLKANIALSIPPGTYTFRVTGAGRNNPISNGFSAYASLGYYSITGNVAGAVLPTRLVVAENSPNGFEIGTVPALNPDADPLAYGITAGNLGGAFALDDIGRLTVANSSALDYEALAATTQLPVQFELFVNITNLANPALTELNRRVVIQVQDVNEPPTISAANVTVLSHTQPGIAIASVSMNDPDAYSILTGTIPAGNDAGVFTFDNSSRQIKVVGDLDATLQSVYDLTLVITDNGIPTLSATNSLKITVLPNSTPFTPGGVNYAIYENIGGSTALSGLTSNPRFPLDPTFEKQLTSFEGDQDRGDAYGSVLRGYLFPPVSGSYTFWIASDDASELWMSGTTNPTTLTRIAYVNTYTSPRQWTQYASQQSTARSLVAGQAYYLEARHKEGGGADHIAVAWRGPATGNQTNIIPGIYLAPRFMNYVPHLTGFTNSGVRRDLFAEASVGQVTVRDVNANDTHTLTILSGNEEGIFHLDANGAVRVADVSALATTPNANFLLTIRATDSGSPSLSATSTVALAVVDADAIVATSLRREMFLDIGSGMTVGDLTNNAKFPGRPDQLETLPGNRFEAAQDVGENYGSRIRGYVIPPVTGNYRFFIASDDASVLRFSMDANPANATVIASVGGWTDFENWTQYPTQTSPLQVGLVAGQRYYLEALHKEGGGGDHVSVAWLVPGSGVTNVIPAANLEPVNLNLPPQISDQSFSVLATVTNGTRLGTINATDSPLDTLAFRLLESDAGDAFALDPVSGDLSVADNTLLAVASVGTAFHLVVGVQDSGYGGLYPLQTSSANVSIIVRGTNNAVWLNPAGGSWSVGANWTNGIVADGADQTADFSQLNLLANATVTLDGSRTIGNLIFGDAVPSHNWTLNAGTDGTLTFAGSNSTLTVNNRGVTIGAELAGTNQLTKAGSGSLTLSNKFNHFSGDFNITGGTVFASIANDQATTSVLGAKTGDRIILVGPGTTLNFNLNNIFGGSGQSAANLPTLNIHGNLISTRFNVLPSLELNGGTLRNANATDPANYDGFQFIGSITVTGTAPSTMDTVTGRGNHLNNGGTTFNVADVTGDAETDFWARTILRNPSDDYGGNNIPAALLKTGVGTMTLTANNTYTGGTLVNEGALQVNGIIAAGGAVTVQSAATLSGGGIINAPVIINPGGHLAPGATLGLLTINNNLTLNGNLVIEVNTASTPTNDWASVSGTLTSTTAGTVFVTNLGPALVAGQSFKLFNQPLVNGEAFAIQPPPGDNLIWTNRLAVDGTIAITSLVATDPVNLTSTFNANELILTWPADHTGWRLQVQTNALAQGLSDNWVDVPDSSTTNWFTIPVDPSVGTVFYRLIYP